MKIFLSFFVVFSYTIVYTQDSTQQIVPGRRNAPAQYDKPYVILISVDGFRYDYAEKYKARNLLKFAANGAKAESMIPSFPSVTFPNHYTIATGLYPAHHGLVYNQFYDRETKKSYSMYDRVAVEDGDWYGGTPLWVLAEKQHMLSASYYFVGTEADIQQTLPTYWYRFNDKIDLNYRIDKVIEWLKLPEEKRPHLITFYISNVDHAGHDYGPESIQTKNAVNLVDETIGHLVSSVNKLSLPVNFVLVSDHGMAEVDTVSPINISTLIDTSLFIIRGGGTSLHLYAKDTMNIQAAYNSLKNNATNYHVYLREEISQQWHYSKSDDRFNRIGDIFLVPEYPKVFGISEHRISPGAHGFDPAMKKMHATFYAWGSGIKKGKTIPSFENIHVYPFICKLLGLTYEQKIDGDPAVLMELLK